MPESKPEAVRRRRLVGGGLAALILATLSATQSYYLWTHDHVPSDFRITIWKPARNVLDHLTPYTESVAEATYPPLVFLSFLPLALLDYGLACVLWAVLLLCCAGATPWVLGIRDWRYYGVYLASAPVVMALLWGNATILVVLFIALFWRDRDRPLWAAGWLSLAIAVKLFAAPLLIWLLLRRRYRTAMHTGVLVPILILGSWAVLRFDGLSDYPRRLSELTELLGDYGIGVQPLIGALGYGSSAALAVGVVVGALCFVLAAQSREELASFTFAVMAVIALTPVSWIYNFGLFVIPLALRGSRLGWWLFGALWVAWAYTPSAYTAHDQATWMLSGVILAITTVLILELRPRLTSITAETRPLQQYLLRRP